MGSIPIIIWEYDDWCLGNRPTKVPNWIGQESILQGQVDGEQLNQPTGYCQNIPLHWKWTDFRFHLNIPKPKCFFEVSPYIQILCPSFLRQLQTESLSWHLDIPWSWWSCTVPSGSCHTLGRPCGIYSYLTITQWWAMPGRFGRWRCESGHFWSCPSGEKCFRCLWSAVATRTGYQNYGCVRKNECLTSDCLQANRNLALLFCVTLTWDEYEKVYHERVPYCHHLISSDVGDGTSNSQLSGTFSK